MSLARPTDVRAPHPDAVPAGIARRLAALSYDALLLAGLLLVLTLLVLAARGGRAIEPGTAWFTGLVLGGVLAFFAGFWTHGGQTLGMTAWQIELRSATGGPVSLRQAIVRFAAAWLSLLPCGLGFVWGVFDARKRAWHDRLAGTVVVRRTAARSARTPDGGDSDDGEQRGRRPGDD